MLGKSQVKYIQSLGHKKQRDEERLFIAEGPKIVAELLDANNMQVKQVFALKGWLAEHKIKYPAIDFIETAEHELQKISQLTTANQVLAVLHKMDEWTDLDPKGVISIVLDGIQDPGNLGTIIRIADWFGIPQLICSNNCADMYNPKLVQSTMGSISRVKIMYTDIEQWLSRQKGIAIYAAALHGKDMGTMPKLNEGIIIIGNESKGISDAVFELVNEKITIPRKGHAESLNAAVATGIILSHLA